VDSAPIEQPQTGAAELPQETVEIQPPQRRGPGRPRKDGSAPPNGPKTEKPGSPKAAAEKPSRRGAKMSAEAVSTLAKQIQGMHAMAAMMTGMGILQISDQEAGLLANGISAVAEEYGLALDGKTGAALQLFGAAAMVYAPRIIHIQKAKAAAQSNIVDAAIVQ
jgi:hypothetical protein